MHGPAPTSGESPDSPPNAGRWRELSRQGKGCPCRGLSGRGGTRPCWDTASTRTGNSRG